MCVYLEKKRKMKIRPFNVFDGLFLLALAFKLTGEGPALSWFDVFAPYLIEAVLAIVGAIAGIFQWGERLKFFAWEKAVGWRLKGLAKKAKAIARKDIAPAGPNKTTGNPGRAYDAELFPNSKNQPNG